MLFAERWVGSDAFERASGWHLQTEGLCRDEVCVPLPSSAVNGQSLDITQVAPRLGMPVVHAADVGLWAIGPPAGGKALASVQAPDVRLPDLDGAEFALASLRGSKVLLLAWASW